MSPSLLVLTLSLSLICLLQPVPGEEINLTGEPGQGYALEILIGTPPQKLNVLLDTGSCTLAVAASGKHAVKRFFNQNNSTTLHDTGQQVEAVYTEGGWVADLVTDYIQIPLLPSVPVVASDVALITTAHDFFSNGSNWEGILGLAYEPKGIVRGSQVIAKPWLGFLNTARGNTASFSLKLCGARSQTNTSHYGSFNVIDETTPKTNNNKTFRTPILREIWYEVGTIAVRVVNNRINNYYSENTEEPNEEICTKLNAFKSIVDSGTSNLRIAEPVYKEIVKQLQEAALVAGYIIFDNFWYHGEFACWPQPRVWNLPWLAIDLLSAEHPNQYFTIELPPESYMHLASAKTTKESNHTTSQFCYYLGLQSIGDDSTILGVTVLEGLEVTFNISAGYIGFQTSPCGPNVKITGPHNTTQNLLDLCKLHKSLPTSKTDSVAVAQWASILSVVIAITLLLVFLAPCFRAKYHSWLVNREMNYSVSRNELIDVGFSNNLEEISGAPQPTHTVYTPSNRLSKDKFVS